MSRKELSFFGNIPLTSQGNSSTSRNPVLIVLSPNDYKENGPDQVPPNLSAASFDYGADREI